MHKPSNDRKNFIEVLMQKSQRNIETCILNVGVQDYSHKFHTSASPQRGDTKRIQILQLGNQGLIGHASKYRKIIVNPIITPRINKFVEWTKKNSQSVGRNMKENDNQRNLSNQDILQFEDMNMAQVFIAKARSQLRQTARSPEYRKRADIKPKSIFGYSKNCLIEIADKQYRKSMVDSKMSQIFSKKIAGQSLDTVDKCCSASFAKNAQLQSPLLARKTSEVKQSRIVKKRMGKDFEEIKKTQQQLIEQQRKNVIRMKKQLKQSYGKPINPPPNITAYSYIVYQPNFSINTKQARKRMNPKYAHSHKVHIAQNSRNTVQVASLTKIMTCILAIEICQKFCLNAAEQIIKIGKFQSEIGGTSARIQPGQIYNLQQILYGLMLPSGNDASLAIAVWGGRLLLHQEQKNGLSDSGSTKESQKTQNSEPVLNTRFKKKDCYKRFLAEMNTKAKQIGLQKTNYANSHGLVNYLNKSCSFDIAVLSQHAMNNQTFKKIVSTQLYECNIKVEVEKNATIKQNGISFSCCYSQNKKKRFEYKQEQIDGDQKELDDLQDEDNNDGSKNPQQKPKQYITINRTVQWQNTHRLLHQKPKQYLGIKTGITTAAGPCLSSCVRATNGRCFIIVVLSCKRMNQRFKDTQILRKWIFEREGLFVKKNGLQVNQVKMIKKQSQSQGSQDD